MGRKVCLRRKGKTLLGIVNKLFVFWGSHNALFCRPFVTRPAWPVPKQWFEINFVFTRPLSCFNTFSDKNPILNSKFLTRPLITSPACPVPKQWDEINFVFTRPLSCSNTCFDENPILNSKAFMYIWPTKSVWSVCFLLLVFYQNNINRLSPFKLWSACILFLILSFLAKMLSSLSRNDNIFARNETMGKICKRTITWTNFS